MNAPALFFAQDEDLAEFQRPADLPRTCTDRDLIEAVKEYLCGASYSELAAMLHIPAATVKQWVRARGWRQIEVLLREQVRELAHNSLSRITHKAFVQLESRLETGDAVYNFAGEQVGFRPIRGKDLAVIASTLIDKQHDVERRMKGEVDESTMVDLNELAKTLAYYAQKRYEDKNMRAINGQVIEEHK